MGLLNGLKNGYPRYFMYQPSKGIDWGTLLNYKARQDALSARQHTIPKMNNDVLKFPAFNATLGQAKWISSQEAQVSQALDNN